MSQHDFDIDNATAAAARVDINLALKALGSLSSGPSAPATTYSNMLWYDTSTNWLYVRNEANSAWVRFAYLDQTSNQIALVDNTSVVGTGGAQTGLLGDQTTATWQAGTGTTQSLASPANVKAAILALTPTQTPSTAQVGSATAGLGAGAVGSYVLGDRQSSGAFGSTVAGSSVYPASMRGVFTATQDSWANAYVGHNSGTLAGTWRQMGGTHSFNTTELTVFLRIS